MVGHNFEVMAPQVLVKLGDPKYHGKGFSVQLTVFLLCRQKGAGCEGNGVFSGFISLSKNSSHAVRRSIAAQDDWLC